jgi:hypothetical protein
MPRSNPGLVDRIRGRIHPLCGPDGRVLAWTYADGRRDDTPQLNRAFAASRRVVIPAGRQMRIDGPVRKPLG